MLKATGTISGVNTSSLMAGVLASVVLHIAIFMGLPLPWGKSGTGHADNESSLQISVQRMNPTDTTTEENNMPDSVKQDQVSNSEEITIKDESPAIAPKPKPFPKKEVPKNLAIDEVLVKKVPDNNEKPVPPITEIKKLIVANKPELKVVQTQVVKPEKKPETKTNTTTHISQTKEIQEKEKPKPAAKNIASMNSKYATKDKGTKSTVLKPLQIASTGKKSKLSRDYRSRIISLVHKNKYYPRRARRNGIQGKATVSFVVRKNGEIKQISILRSSKKKILDLAAIKTIKRIGVAPPFPSSIKRSQWKFAIPITYSLR